MKKVFAIILAAAMAMSLVACGGSKPAETTAAPAETTAAPAETTAAPAETTAAPAADAIVIKLGHGSAPSDTDPYHKFATLFKQYVEEATEGKVVIEIYSGGQLGGEMDSYEGLGMGTVDMCIATANIFGMYYEKCSVMDLPFLYATYDDCYKLLDSDMMQGLLTELADVTNAVHLGWGSGGFRNIFNNVRPINTTADLADVKLRVPETTIFVDTFQAIGAKVVPMTYSECYTAISQGTIDGIEVPIGNGFSVGFHEVCKYYSLSHHFYNAFSMSIGRDLYESLDPEIQQILKDCAVRAGKEQREFVEGVEAEQLKAMEDAGLVVNEIEDMPAWRAQCQSIYDNYKNNVDADIFAQAMEILGIE